MKFRWLRAIFKRKYDKEPEPCVFITDHEPVWDGQMYSCWKCGLEFKSTGHYLSSNEKEVSKEGEE